VTELRPLEERDIPRISALRRQLFRQTSQDGSLDQYYHRTFFENPWRSDAYPSWVLVGGSGEVAGFIGVIPLVTGLVGFCPLYRLVGLNTCPAKK